MNRSPLAPDRFPDLPDVAGVELRTARAGYKRWERDDLTLALLTPGTTVAGVLTRSACPSPEVEWCRKALVLGSARALVVNAGNSNAFTGHRGRETVEAIAARVAGATGVLPSDVFVASTGVIGVPLPVDRAERGIDLALSTTPTDWRGAAKAITTTDTFEKGATRSATIAGHDVTLVGIAKGSGMIAPDMATMLAFVFTDAAISPTVLQTMIARANGTSFSAITVDGDTSTSDTLLAFATGRAGHVMVESMEDDGADALADAISDLCRDLALQVVRDGEGATKLIEVQVTGAASDGSAHRVAMSIANSPLVKTAIAGGDANWGRVVMAVGKAGEPAERDLLSIHFGITQVASDGAVVTGYDEVPVAEHLKGTEIEVGVDLGMGSGRATVWTCDLTHGYISINADYRS